MEIIEHDLLDKWTPFQFAVELQINVDLWNVNTVQAFLSAIFSAV